MIFSSFSYCSKLFTINTCYFHNHNNMPDQKIILIFKESSRNPYIAMNSSETQFSHTLSQILPEAHIRVFALINASSVL